MLKDRRIILGQLACVLSAYHNGEVITVCVNRVNKLYFFSDDYKVRFVFVFFFPFFFVKQQISRMEVLCLHFIINLLIDAKDFPWQLTASE